MPTTDREHSRLIERYRTLLKKEASPKALEESLELVQDVANVRLEMSEKPGSPDSRRDRPLSAGALELIEPQLKEIRSNRHRLDPKQKSMVYRIIAALTLPRFFQTLDASLSPQRLSLLLDATQILFHQSYFVLALEPGIISSGARKALLEALLNYAAQLPLPADSFRTMALVKGAMGDSKSAEFFARRSLDETSPTAHEYLTVLQTAWGRYIDDERFGPAMLLLLEEIGAGRITAANFPEFLELADQTLEMWRDAKEAATSNA